MSFSNDHFPKQKRCVQKVPLKKSICLSPDSLAQRGFLCALAREERLSVDEEAQIPINRSMKMSSANTTHSRKVSPTALHPWRNALLSFKARTLLAELGGGSQLLSKGWLPIKKGCWWTFLPTGVYRYHPIGVYWYRPTRLYW